MDSIPETEMVSSMGDFIAQCLWVDLININKVTYKAITDSFCLLYTGLYTGLYTFMKTLETSINDITFTCVMIESYLIIG